MMCEKSLGVKAHEALILPKNRLGGGNEWSFT